MHFGQEYNRSDVLFSLHLLRGRCCQSVLLVVDVTFNHLSERVSTGFGGGVYYLISSKTL